MARYGQDFDNRSRADFHYWDHFEAPLPVRRYGGDFQRERPAGYGGDYRGGRSGYGGDFRGQGGGARGFHGYAREFTDGQRGQGFYRQHGFTAWGPEHDFGNYNMDRGFRNLLPRRQNDRGWNTGW